MPNEPVARSRGPKRVSYATPVHDIISRVPPSLELTPWYRCDMGGDLLGYGKILQSIFGATSWDRAVVGRTKMHSVEYLTCLSYFPKSSKLTGYLSTVRILAYSYNI